jgi:hypothetical protein
MSYFVFWENLRDPLSTYIYKRLCPSKKICNRKKERATETLNLKLNTKPLKFKCSLADGGGGVGWSTHARHGYPHLVPDILHLYFKEQLFGKQN